jgi:hypothetical protein
MRSPEDCEDGIPGESQADTSVSEGFVDARVLATSLDKRPIYASPPVIP